MSGSAIYNTANNVLISDVNFSSNIGAPTIYNSGTITWDCPLGYYQPTNGNIDNPKGTTFNTCLNACPAGFYGALHNLTALPCSGLCPPGHYCDHEATVTPLPCPAGTAFGSVGARHLNDCNPCASGQFQNMYAPHHQSPQSNRFAMVELMPRSPCCHLMPQFCTCAMRLHPCSILKTSCSVLAGPLRHPARHALRAPTPTSLAALHASPVRHTATALSLRRDRSLSRFATVQRAPSRIKWACTPQASVVRALPVAGAAWAAASIAQPIRMPT